MVLDGGNFYWNKEYNLLVPKNKVISYWPKQEEKIWIISPKTKKSRCFLFYHYIINGTQGRHEEFPAWINEKIVEGDDPEDYDRVVFHNGKYNDVSHYGEIRLILFHEKCPVKIPQKP